MREAVEEDHQKGHSRGSAEQAGERGDKKEQPGTDPNPMFAPMEGQWSGLTRENFSQTRQA